MRLSRLIAVRTYNLFLRGQNPLLVGTASGWLRNLDNYVLNKQGIFAFMEKKKRKDYPVKPRTCSICDTVYTPPHHNRKIAPYCTRSCALEAIRSRRKRLFLPCVQCGQITECSGKVGLLRARMGRPYCSKECMDEFLRPTRSLGLVAFNRQYASARMKASNPMSNPEAKAKMVASMKGRTFLSRGGNGQPTKPQIMLAQALGWDMETVIETASVKGQFASLPHCYKVDVGHPGLKLAVEVDGQTHKLKKWKFLDRRKTEVLNSLGWRVIRFWNEEVLSDVDKCAQLVLSAAAIIERGGHL